MNFHLPIQSFFFEKNPSTKNIINYKQMKMFIIRFIEIGNKKLSYIFEKT
jgi:hypothetical protein